jgi:hypothetical protein
MPGLAPRMVIGAGRNRLVSCQHEQTPHGISVRLACATFPFTTAPEQEAARSLNP